MKVLKSAFKHMSRKLRGTDLPKQKGIMSYDLKPIAEAVQAVDMSALTFFVSKYEMKSIIEVTRSFTNGWSFLHYAAKRGQGDVLKFFIEHGADANDRDRRGATPLHVAAANGHKATVALLLASGANLELTDADGNTAQRLAEEQGHKIVSALLKKETEDHRDRHWKLKTEVKVRRRIHLRKAGS